MAPGSSAQLGLLRNCNEKPVSVILGQLPSTQPINDDLWIGRTRFQRITRMSASTLSLLQRVTAMISALFVTAAAAQQTPPQPQQAPATTPAPASPELAPSIASWQQAIVARIARFQRYPAQAKGATGVANLSFSIDRQGHVLNSQIIKSSGSSVLDAEALFLLTRAAPLPPPPAAVPDTDLTFVLPIRFEGSSKQ